MRSYNWILSLLFLTSLSAFSQDKYIKHTVPRETISQIAAHYNNKSSAIYSIDSRKGIKFKSILLIPTLVSKLRIPYHQLKILSRKIIRS
jgi:hypothetical protein